MGLATCARRLPEGSVRRSSAFIVAGLVSALSFSFLASSAFALSPSVGSKSATNVDYSTATLNGTVNPSGLETNVYFEYGPTISYGSKTAEVSVGSGSSALEIAKAVTGLTPNTTYNYRVVATNADGTSTGGNRTFHVGWNVQTPAATSGTSVLEDVSCTSATECTAVGWSGTQAIAQRWNGTEWKAQTPAKPAGSTETVLQGVSCASSTACAAVGRYKNSSAKWVTLVEAWDGSEWKVQSSPNPSSSFAELEDVSCTSATECTAVGTYWNSGPPETSQTLAMRWNGTEWKIQTTPNPVSNSVYLTSVSCATSTFCMATGFYYDSANAKYVPLSERWDGSEWTLKTAVQPAGSTMSWFYGVSCTSSTACTAVGDKEINAGTHQHQTMAQRWNGTSWSLQATPNPEGNNLEFNDVSCISFTVCTGIGHASSGGTQTPMALQWNGSTWSLQMLPLPSGATGANTYSFGVSCILSRGCQMVGQYTNASSVITPLAEANWRQAAPTATTIAATSIGEKAATINGTVNPNGSETKAYFEYGKSLSEMKSAEVNLASGSSTVETSVPLTGLSPSTSYVYRVVANNENPETSRGTVRAFRTTGPPTVSTLAAKTDEIGEEATLEGQVNPSGFSTTYQFEFGTSPGVYTTKVPAVAESVGSGSETKTVSYTVTGLSPGQTYYYRITATNAAGKSNGSEVSFTTPTGLTLKAEGTPLKSGASLKVFSSNFTFVSGSGKVHYCEEVELSGEVLENPGAKESVTAPKLQNAEGAKCVYNGTLTVQYSIPPPMYLEFERNEAEGIVEPSNFKLRGTIYSGAMKITECEWEAQLAGNFNFNTPLLLQLSGSLGLIKGSVFFCFANETMSGSFAVTSGGSAVEAIP